MSTDKRQWHGWLYLLPIIILMAVFTFYPLIKTILISFDPVYDSQTGQLHWSKFSFVNYRDIIAPQAILVNGQLRIPKNDFLTALKNTLWIVGVTVPLSTIIALAISVALVSVKKIRSFFQTIFFLPYITNVIAIGLVFSVLFNAQSGLINSFIQGLGGKPINWVNPAGNGFGAPSKFHMMFVALLYITWSGLPFKILIFVGGLLSVNKQLYQAAQIDSTPKWRVFRKITVPQISPLILYIVITSLIGAFKTYSAIIGIFPPQSNEGKRMQTLVGYVYDIIGSGGSYSLAAAGAVVLFIIILVMTAVNIYFSKKRVHY